jgi:hypothetical protein
MRGSEGERTDIQGSICNDPAVRPARLSQAPAMSYAACAVYACLPKATRSKKTGWHLKMVLLLWGFDIMLSLGCAIAEGYAEFPV